MGIIKVVVESTLSGSLNGFESLSINDSQTVEELINQFCLEKGAPVPVHPRYGLVGKENRVLGNEQQLSDYFIGDGEVLQLIRLKSSPTLMFRQSLTISAIGLFVGIVGSISCVLLHVVFTNVKDNYALVIDAGPTQTDMILYSWPGKKRNNTGEVIQLFSCSASGGIDQFAPENISSYLGPCFHSSYDAILEESRKDAEVLFGATDGMRLMDPDAASEVISAVQSSIAKSEFENKPMSVEIIPGPMEGVSGWITVNFLQERVLHKGLLNSTFGAMALGEATTRIALEVDASSKDLPNVHPVTLFGSQYYVFSQSYLCHGVVQALDRYRGMLRMEQGTNNILSPCEPLGWNMTLRSSDFSPVCTDFLNVNESSEWEMFVTGTGNHEECKRAVSRLLNYSECIQANMGHCLDPSHLPSDVTDRHFYAFDAFNYITEGTGIPSGAPLKHVERYLKAMCDYDIDELVQIKANSKNKPSHRHFFMDEGRNFEQLCFEGQYVVTLLTQVYGFNSDAEWSQIMFADQVMGTTLGWSLGYMVNATSEIGSSPPVPRLKVFPFSLLIILFFIFIIFSIGFIVHGLKERKNSPGYRKLL